MNRWSSILATTTCGVLMTGAIGACTLEPEPVDFRSDVFGIGDEGVVVRIGEEDEPFFSIFESVALRHSREGGIEEPLMEYDETGIWSLTNDETCTFSDDGTALHRDGLSYFHVGGGADARIYDADGAERYMYAGHNFFTAQGSPLGEVTQGDMSFNLTQAPDRTKLLVAVLLEGICGSPGI